LSRARGMISLSANSRAVSRTSRCSSVSSKSIGTAGRLFGRLGGRVLDHRGEALAHADAHRRDAVAGAAAAELPQERGGQAGARAAERVAERDGAAVHVQLLVRDVKLA